MSCVIHSGTCKAMIKCKRSHENKLPCCKLTQSSSISHYYINQCSNHSKHRSGSTCGDYRLPSSNFCIIRNIACTHSANQINKKIAYSANFFFQAVTEKYKHQHIISQMCQSEMKKHTGKKPIIFMSLFYEGCICSSPVYKMPAVQR